MVKEREREPRDLSHPEHPLFPIEEDGKTFEVSFINVARKEGGAMMLVPQLFRSEELTSLDQIVERFGGGTYELTARSNSPMNPGQAYRITKRRLVTLPGKSKALDPSNMTMQEEVAAGLRPSPFEAPKAPQGLTGDSAVLIAIMQMGQQAAQAQAAQSQQFMALMMQMMQEGKKESAESMRMMMNMFATMTTSSQNSMMQLIPLLVTQKGGGPEDIEKYLSLFEKLRGSGAPAPKDDEGESELNVGEVLSNVATIMQSAPAAISALKEMGPGGGAPNGLPTLPGAGPLEAPPGSAASVLGKG